MFHSRLAMPAAALAVAACAATAPVALGPDADTRSARRLLSAAATAGPVRLEDNLPPSGAVLPRPLLEQAAAEGVPNLTVRFAAPPAAAGSARLLLLFDPPPDLEPTRACGAALPAPEFASGPARLRTVFCDGGAYIADAAASAPGRGPEAIRRLIWRTTSRLFPDDYADSYGFDLFGNRIGVGGAFGF